MSITTLKALSEKLSKELTVETFKFIDGVLKAYGEKEVRYAACDLVATFVGSLIYRTLTEPRTLNVSPLDHEQRVMKNVGELKSQIQEAVAQAFQNSMSAFSGNYVEYYCQIKPAPNPPNNLTN